ncbi:MAG: molybdenum cofactor guanylyltransferase [Chitinophagales bacterium]|nr:molybdenum cofactor guanylyltransferase [Chitinophagales bacterium]
MKKYENISAIILAGGKSSRMGSDKGLIEFHGKKMIEHLLDLLQPLFENVFIISNNEAYKNFHVPVFEDVHKNFGPIGGLHSGLTHSSTHQNLFVACDLPFINQELIEFILEKQNEFDAVIPYHQNLPEPLCALYSKDCLLVFEEMIEAQQFKIQDSFDRLKICKLDVSEKFFESKNPFANMNTTEDLMNS